MYFFNEFFDKYRIRSGTTKNGKLRIPLSYCKHNFPCCYRNTRKKSVKLSVILCSHHFLFIAMQCLLKKVLCNGKIRLLNVCFKTNFQYYEDAICLRLIPATDPSNFQVSYYLRPLYVYNFYSTSKEVIYSLPIFIA